MRPLNFKLYLKNMVCFFYFENSENPHDSKKYFRPVLSYHQKGISFIKHHGDQHRNNKLGPPSLKVI
jgi:hypothetical protein